MMAYEPLTQARYQIEMAGADEVIRIPARKRLFVMLFLPVWLTGWTAGGIAAVTQVIHGAGGFLVVWLCFWAVGWVFAAGTLVWMLFGAELLRVAGGDLVVALAVGPWSWRRVYNGREIRRLQVAVQPPWLAQFQLPSPLTGAQSGAVKFDYGARTVHVAGGLDEAEGRAIIGRLAVRLPPSAQAGTN